MKPSKLGFTAWLVAGALCCSLAGCKTLFKKRQTEAAPSATVTAVATVTEIAPLAAASAEPVATAPVVDEASIPAPQDFEDEAFEKVTKKNFKTEFARLKKEIEAK